MWLWSSLFRTQCLSRHNGKICSRKMKRFEFEWTSAKRFEVHFYVILISIGIWSQSFGWIDIKWMKRTLAETCISLFFCFCLSLFFCRRCCFSVRLFYAIAKKTACANQNFDAWFLLTNYLIRPNKYLEKFERQSLNQQTFLSLICFFCRNYNDPFFEEHIK